MWPSIKLGQIFYLKYNAEKRTSVLLPALHCIIFMSVSSSFRKFKIKCSIIRVGRWGDKISGYSYHEDDGQQDAGDEHHWEAVHKPGQPVDAVTQAHHPHCLLQPGYKTINLTHKPPSVIDILPHFLFMDNWLDNHGGGVDPGQGHEHGEGPRDGDDEPVLDVAGVGHLLEGDAGQGGHVAPRVDADHGVLHQVLEIREPIIQILVVNPRPPPGPWSAEPILSALGAVHLVRVNTNLVSEELGKISGVWKNTRVYAFGRLTCICSLPSSTSTKTRPAQSLLVSINSSPLFSSWSSLGTDSNLLSSTQSRKAEIFWEINSKLSRLVRQFSLKKYF